MTTTQSTNGSTIPALPPQPKAPRKLTGKLAKRIIEGITQNDLDGLKLDDLVNIKNTYLPALHERLEKACTKAAAQLTSPVVRHPQD